MMICKCDICGREVKQWIACTCEPTYLLYNIDDYKNIERYKGEHDICENCFKELLKKRDKKI